MKSKRKKTGGGSRKGIPNKATALTREFIQGFLDQNAGRIQNLFDRVAKKEPREALKLITDLCEFALPKLARVETTMTVRKELKDFTDDEIIAILTERNAQRVKPGETRDPAAGATQH